MKQALMDLGEERPGLDVRPLEGRPPWQRLRAGDWRIVFRRLTPEESALVVLKDDRTSEAPTFLVARVVNRRDLDKAIKTL